MFVARGEHLEALRTQGLRVVGAEKFTVSPSRRIGSTPGASATWMPILFCVKLYDTESAAAQLEPLLADHTVVVTLQNGVESRQRIGSVIGEETRAALVLRIFRPVSMRRARSPLKARSRASRWLRSATGQGDSSQRVKQLIQELQNAGIAAAVIDDANLMLWEKFCWIAGVSGVTAVTRQPIGIVRADPDMRALCLPAASASARRWVGLLGYRLDCSARGTVDGPARDQPGGG